MTKKDKHNLSSKLCRERRWRQVLTARAKREGWDHTTIPYIRGRHCQICGREGSMAVDHDHVTKVFRGWLCRRCNLALGAFEDNPVILKHAILYLEAE